MMLDRSVTTGQEARRQPETAEASGSWAEDANAYAKRAAMLARDVSAFAAEIAAEAPTGCDVWANVWAGIVEEIEEQSEVLRKVEGDFRRLSNDLHG
jgi:hypothetical protein